MTATESMVASFTSGLSGPRFRRIFDILEANGLHPLGKSNTATLLYQKWHDATNRLDIFAFRVGPPPVISFPKSFWLPRARELNAILEGFGYADRPPITGPVSETQFSAGQVAISRSTIEQIEQVCVQVCNKLTDT